MQYANQRLHSIDNGNLRLTSILKSPDDKVASTSAIEPPPSFEISANIALFTAADLDAEASEEGLKPSARPIAMQKQTSSLSDSATLPLPSVQESRIQPQPKPIVNISGWNNHAESKSKTKKRDAKSKVSEFLLTLRDNGSINAQRISSTVIPDWICASGNKCYYRYCLEFLQFISATDDALALCIAKIADSKTDDTGALTAAQEIANACFDNIKALDGKQVRNHTTIALGTWVRDYKKQIATARQQIQPDQKFTAENVDLVTADELQQLVAQGAPGTPVGNQSILSYTTTRKNANNYITSRFT